MNADETMLPIYAYFLLDRTNELKERQGVIQRKLGKLFGKYQGATPDVLQIKPQVILMDKAAVQVIEDFASELSLPVHLGCDLGGALNAVRTAIKQTPHAHYEIFILLSSEPGGEWRQLMADFKRISTVRFTVFGFGGVQRIHEQTLALLSSGREAIHRFEPPVSDYLTQTFEHIARLLNAALVHVQPISPMSSATQVIPLGTVVQPPSAATIATETRMMAEPGDKLPDGTEMVAPSPAPVLVTEGGVATIWKELDADPNAPYQVEHVVKEALIPPGNLRLIGASRRGKLHAHKGIFREDSFALGEMHGWQLMVVADGGGSNAYARVGAKLAAEVGIKTMQEVINQPPTEPVLDSNQLCQNALESAVADAWKALEAKAIEMEWAFSDLGTTFLAVMYRLAENLVGVAQIGDGLLAAETEDGVTKVLAEPDVGATASVTWFLTSKHWSEWTPRVRVIKLDVKLRLLAAMSDGVADDFIPFDQHLCVLFDNLKQKVLTEPQPEDALLAFLNYEKRGSFDDRTLAMIYQPGSAATVVPVISIKNKPRKDVSNLDPTIPRESES